MTAPPITIPYEPQSDPLLHRGCGAACLSMVYKSFGKEIPQAEIWPLIAKPNRFGSVSSTTHLMALHAQSQGLSAIVVQARHPLQVLRLCREGGIRAILNHRPRPDTQTGHYTVLVDIDDKNVVVHDPGLGPSRTMSHAELLQLWQPQSSNSEILGNVLIGIAAEPVAIPECEFCHTAVPATVDCPKCQKPVGLSPAALLGCIRDGCIARMWNYVGCPSCDFVWSFNEAGTSAAAAQPMPAGTPASSPIPPPPNLDAVFAQLDKFTAHILTIPGAGTHADLNAQLDVLKAGKDKLTLAQAEGMVGYRARVERFAAFAAQSHENIDAQRKKVEELNAPLPPLDGNALAADLLKNLGFK